MILAFFWTETLVYLTVAALLFAILLGLAFLNKAANGKWLGGLILGADKRGSTSKAAALLWTIIVVWALGTLFIGGGKVYERSCSDGAEKQAAAEEQAERAGMNEQNQLEAGLEAVEKQARTGDDDCRKLADMRSGWELFLNEGLKEEYLLLLGFPVAVAVAAKGITTAKLQSGTAQKTEAVRRGSAGGRLAAVTADFYSDDEGTADLGDLQYLLFNLLAVAYFFSEFVSRADLGLPDIPDTLLGLTSVSASLYVAKKAVERQQPVIDSVLPARAKRGDTIRVLGSFLGVGAVGAGKPQPTVTVGGEAAAGSVVVGEGELRVEVPDGAPSGTTEVKVTTAAGIATDGLAFEVYEPRPIIVSIRPRRVVLGTDQEVRVVVRPIPGGRVDGDWVVSLDDRPLTILSSTPSALVAQLPTGVEAAAAGTENGEVEIAVEDNDGNPSEPATIRIDGPGS